MYIVFVAFFKVSSTVHEAVCVILVFTFQFVLGGSWYTIFFSNINIESSHWPSNLKIEKAMNEASSPSQSWGSSGPNSNGQEERSAEELQLV